MNKTNVVIIHVKVLNKTNLQKQKNYLPKRKQTNKLTMTFENN